MHYKNEETVEGVRVEEVRVEMGGIVMNGQKVCLIHLCLKKVQVLSKEVKVEVRAEEKEIRVNHEDFNIPKITQ